MIIDLFTYTTETKGGTLSIEALIEEAKLKQLDGICVTDIDSSYCAPEYIEEGRKRNFFVAVGVEIPCKDGVIVMIPREVDDDFADEMWKDFIPENALCSEVIDYAEKIDAAVIARKVFDEGSVMRANVLNLKGLTAIDTISAKRNRSENEKGLEAQNTLSVCGVSGSGVLTDIEELGSTVTIVNCEELSQKALVRALRSENVWAASLTDLGENTPVGQKPTDKSFYPSDVIGGRRNFPSHERRNERRRR